MTEALLYRIQSTDLLTKSMDWFLYDNGLRMKELKTRVSIHSEGKLFLKVY